MSEVGKLGETVPNRSRKHKARSTVWLRFLGLRVPRVSKGAVALAAASGSEEEPPPGRSGRFGGSVDNTSFDSGGSGKGVCGYGAGLVGPQSGYDAGVR